MSEITGKLIKVMPEQTGEGKAGPWVKQDFLLETLGEYPKKVCMNVWNEKARILRTFQLGDVLKVTFEPSSREYMDKWYTDLRVWKIDKAGAPGSTSPQPHSYGAPQSYNQQTGQTTSSQPSTAVPLQDEDIPPAQDNGDLPF